MHTFDNFTACHSPTDRRVLKLARRLDGARTTREIVDLVYAIAATRHPDAADLLGELLGHPEERVARVVMRALLSLGRRAASAATRVASESSDPRAVTHARIVLTRVRGFVRRPTEAARRDELSQRHRSSSERNDPTRERT